MYYIYKAIGLPNKLFFLPLTSALGAECAETRTNELQNYFVLMRAPAFTISASTIRRTLLIIRHLGENRLLLGSLREKRGSGCKVERERERKGCKVERERVGVR